MGSDEISRSSPSLGEASRLYGLGRLGVRIAWATSVVTLVSFVLALTALPDKVPYPFTDEVIAAQWPGDYYWMFPAMVLMLLFVALVATLHEYAPAARRIYSLTALCVAVIAAGVLLINYYIQSSVMQPSLEKGQLDGWSIFTQYNPNGVFIALEELGYLLMSIVFLCLAPLFTSRTRREKVLRWLFRLSFAAVVLSLGVVSALMGIDRADIFEIIVISIVWLTLITAGPLLAGYFKQEGTAAASSADRS